MRYSVWHETVYNYGEPVTLCHNQAHLTPRGAPHQRTLAARVSVSPEPAIVRSRRDYFGNEMTYFTIEQVHQKLVVTAQMEVEVLQPSALPGKDTLAWEAVRAATARGETPLLREAAAFTFPSPLLRRLDEARVYAEKSFTPGRPALEGVLDLTRRIHEEFKFDPQATSVNTPLREVFERRRGVCQDFAHVQISCLRSMGLAARYVSGYLRTRPPAGQPRRVGTDVSHAWIGCCLPELGWIDVDPTNNLVVGLEHITVAWGRDYSDVLPIKGVFLGGGSHDLKVSVDVSPVVRSEPADA